MATWNDLPMELRLMIFKLKRQLLFIERKNKLIELLKGRTVKIVETLNDTELYISVQNERCSSRQLRTFFTKVIYCEYRWDASVEMTVLLMWHTSRLAMMNVSDFSIKSL